jgi:hypothetical protein
MRPLQQRAQKARADHAKGVIDARQASALAADKKVTLPEARLEVAKLQAQTAPVGTPQTVNGSETPEASAAQTAGRP